MEISGHKTRSVFDRYNIVSEEDLADAAERASAYVAERQEERGKVVPLTAATGTDDRNADTGRRSTGMSPCPAIQVLDFEVGRGGFEPPTR
jgi:hypothetical protein